MAKYTGVPCPVCNEKFSDKSDVVVCPICGAPHHRECYQKLGHCAFENEHATGTVWKRQTHDAETTRETAGESVCPRCGTQVEPDSIFCKNCGVALFAGHPKADAGQAPFYPPDGNGPRGYVNPYGPSYGDPRVAELSKLPPEIAADDVFDDVTAKDLADYVGPNSRYYLRQFNILKHSSFFFSFNIPAFVFNFLYFFYRKMYLIGSIFLVAFLMIMSPSFVAAIRFFAQMGPIDPSQAAQFTTMIQQAQSSAVYQDMSLWLNLSNILFYVWWMAAPLVANLLYYRNALRNIHAVKATDQYQSNPSACLAKKGGVGLSMVLVALGIIVMLFVAYFYISLYFLS